MMPVRTTAAKPLLLVFPFEQLAHYLRCLTLAQHLAGEFDVRIAYSERYASFIKTARFETFPCAGMNADAVLECVKKFDFSWLQKEALDAVLQRQIDAIEMLKPALVLGDTLPTLAMAAEKTGVPYVSLQNGYMSKYYAGARRMSWRFPLYPILRWVPQPLLDRLTKVGEQRSFQQIHQPFAALRQEHGLLKKRSYADELEGDLNLLCDLPELFPQQSLPASYQIIPPLIYKTERSSHVVLKKLDRAKRTLFVSMGSTGDWQYVSFLNEAPFHKYNIITAGDAAGVVQGSHVISEPFVNVEDLLPAVDLVLCHGGNGTIYQALKFGIPVLCKTAHFEQEWNVQALERLGLGASLDSVKTGRGYLKNVEKWMGKKESKPFRQIKQALAQTPDSAPLIQRLKGLVPKVMQVYYPTQKQSA